MYGESLFGTFKKTNLKVAAAQGEIKIDAVIHKKKYQEKEISTSKEVSITAIKGNIFLTH
jgi:hypothetical protein